MPAGRAAPAVGGNRRVDRLFQVLDVPLLISVGWDPVVEVFAPDRDHPLLGYRVCRVAGCGLEAWHPDGLCCACRARFAAAGGDLGRVLRAGRGPPEPSPGQALPGLPVPGFERPVGTNDLCLSCDGLRRHRGQSVAAYVAGDAEFPPAAPRLRPGTVHGGLLAGGWPRTRPRVCAAPTTRRGGVPAAAIWPRSDWPGRPLKATGPDVSCSPGFPTPWSPRSSTPCRRRCQRVVG